MAEAKEVDENPTIEFGKPKSKEPLIRVDPAFGVTAVSIFANFTISNVFIYGAIGNFKLSYLLSLVTIPTSVYLCIRDANKDWENWEKTRKYREKNFPKALMPYKVKYDWSKYEDVMIRNREMKLERKKLADENSKI